MLIAAQLAFTYPGDPGWKKTDTSKEAALKMVDSAPTIRDQVLRILYLQELTADEVAKRLGLEVTTVRPRLSELREMGNIQDTGRRRKNDSGVNAIVWAAVRR